MTLLEAWKIARQQGLDWVSFRLLYGTKAKLGIVRRRLPICSWTDFPLRTWLAKDIPSSPEHYAAWRAQHNPNFFFNDLGDLAQPMGRFIQPTCSEAALAGRWRYFGHTEYDIGFFPDWHLNPETGRRLDSARHWSQLSEFGDGDVKLVWEPSRLGVVYSLARSYVVTGNDRYAAAFWTLVEDWARHNPPQSGINWFCGQEAAIRLIACCFGCFAFRGSSQSTPDRLAQLATILAFHARRIEGNIEYALSQNNNHGLSEAAGLWTVGLLWPEFACSDHWRRLGKQLLEDQIQKQIADDGSYVQHSTNYHRLMLHILLWSFRLGERNGDRFSQHAYARFARAVAFLIAMTDRESGGAPNHGSNDGALLFPLNSCDYTDYRPVLQAGYYLLHQKRLFPSGPWDEDLLWLFGRDALGAPPAEEPPTESTFPTGGYYLLRGRESWGMVRCARYRTRPAHADQLHFDLWWRGINIAVDPGTYLYNGDPPWRNGLAGTSVHNTVTVDGIDQMTRASVFLWTDWSEGRVRSSHADGPHFWEGEHNGYRQRLGIVHRRMILSEGDSWIIVDDVLGGGRHVARLHWLLPDVLYRIEDSRIELQTLAGKYIVQAFSSSSATVSAVRAGSIIFGEAVNDTLRGWISRYYGHKEAALSFALSVQGLLPIRFVTVFSADAFSCQMTSDEFVLRIVHTEINIPKKPVAGRPISVGITFRVL